MMNKNILFAGLMVLSSYAFASGSIECKFNHKNTEHTLQGSYSLMGRGIVTGLKLRSGNKTQDISQEQIIGFWNHGSELKIQIMDLSTLNDQLVIQTKLSADSQENYEGTVALYEGESELTEKVECWIGQ